MQFKHYFFLLSGFLVFFTACQKDYVKIDKELIEDYLADNGLTAQIITPEGIYYVEEIAGTGANPTINDAVTVHYEGFLLNGTKFDSSIDRGVPATFPLQAVIEGWQLGIPLFKVGGTGKLLIPSALAYGENPPQGSEIKCNDVLLFDIQLIDIE